MQPLFLANFVGKVWTMREDGYNLSNEVNIYALAEHQNLNSIQQAVWKYYKGMFKVMWN